MENFTVFLKALPGVRHFIDHTCVPANNNWVPWPEGEEIFSSGKIHYAGQAIGLILADSLELAVKALSLVKVTYKNKKSLVTKIRDGLKPQNSDRLVANFPMFWGMSPKNEKIGDTTEQEKRDDVVKIEGERPLLAYFLLRKIHCAFAVQVLSVLEFLRRRRVLTAQHLRGA